ncbi:MAG: YggS family pyridoxal phosphate-dependent enzyme [Clostridium sp.]|nr:YggS family pyridoxal phosphate-dependent enzyme [Clostridium sp.]
MSTVEYNLSELRKEIVPYKPIIIAVTKYFGADKLIEAYNDGLRDFGENRVQDALLKFESLPDEIKRNSRFHLIGHLQKNKVKKAVGAFDLIQSVDSLKLAQAISQEALNKNIVQKVLLQVNNANEEAKSGFSVGDINRDFKDIISLRGIKVEGLMNIAPITGEEELKRLFKGMYDLKVQLEKEYAYNLKELSMGMSNDYKIALSEGSTMIRIGRKLFT